MIDLQAKVNDQTVSIKYRIYRKPLLQINHIKKLCLLSRYHDGHVREAAIRELLTLRLPAYAVPYVFISLVDYVIEISSLPNEASDELRLSLIDFIKANPEALETVKSVIISYWNEYYRNRYEQYADYPPYACLRSLEVL